MSTGELIFKFFNVAVVPVWIALAFFHRKEFTKRWILNYRIPFILGVCYIIFLSWGMIDNFGAGGGMGSLEALRISFNNDLILTGAWLHYLVFDLLIGIHIVKGFYKYELETKVLPIILSATLFFGPFGFVIYRIYLIKKGKEQL